jgi:hypothetical protein
MLSGIVCTEMTASYDYDLERTILYIVLGTPE